MAPTTALLFVVRSGSTHVCRVAIWHPHSWQYSGSCFMRRMLAAAAAIKGLCLMNSSVMLHTSVVMVDLRPRPWRQLSLPVHRPRIRTALAPLAPLYPEGTVPQLAALLFAEDLVAVLLFEPRQVDLRVNGDAEYGILAGVHSDLQICVGQASGVFQHSSGPLLFPTPLYYRKSIISPRKMIDYRL
jgi:hypothetical protein